MNKLLQKSSNKFNLLLKKRKTAYHLEDLGQDKPQSFNHKMAQITELSCLQSDYSFRYMYSGAGHDAMNFLFVQRV
ncbi:hypothetical protein J4710_03940 [Staphylococcus xylosus]|uniref:Uncharacterized protein n=1 Tax=Staphylococcus xylosus TaxID=1288 RepID=A0A939NCR2_STAXY|nr:hypothetical protein [Staphylococcus xylosus]